MADAREARDGFVNLLVGRGDDDERRAERDEAPGPRGELSAEADVERAADVARAEVRGGAHVEDDVAAALREQKRDLRGRERGGARQLGERRGAGAVDLRVALEVGGPLGQVCGHQADELLSGHRLERVVEAALLAHGRGGLLRDVAPAHRACAVRGVDLHLVRELQELAVQTVVEHPGHHLGRVAARAREVGPPHVADEERVAGQDLLRLGRRPPCR